MEREISELRIRLIDLFADHLKCSLKFYLCCHLSYPPLLDEDKTLSDVILCLTLGGKWTLLSLRQKEADFSNPCPIFSSSRAAGKCLSTVGLGKYTRESGKSLESWDREKFLCFPRVNFIYSQAGLGLYQETAHSPHSLCLHTNSVKPGSVHVFPHLACVLPVPLVSFLCY